MRNRVMETQARAVVVFLIILLIIALTPSSSCVIGTRETPPPGAPQIKVTFPSGELPAGDVRVTVEVSNFKLSTGDRKQGAGQVIYYLDVPVPTYYDHLAITTGGTYATSTDTSYTWKNVTPGQHTFSAQLVNSENKPLPAPAVASVTVNVGAPEGNPALKIQPDNNSELPPGMIVISAQADNFIVSGRDMGPVNREGSGHFIYYIDEDPPTDQGQPAVTDNSVVSASPTQRWKSVSEGKHSFAVQLVNNDDTPLTPPVTANITLNIKPAA